MKYVKIIIKNNYEKKGDIVLRSYIRALKRVGKVGELFLNGDQAIIFGVVDQKGKFHEIFTSNIIDYSDYEDLTHSEFNNLCEIFVSISDEEVKHLEDVMESVLFGEKIDLGFDVSTRDELSSDIYVEFDAYNDSLSMINPFQRLLPEEDQSYYNAYNSLFYKVKAYNKMKERNEIDKSNVKINTKK